MLAGGKPPAGSAKTKGGGLPVIVGSGLVLLRPGRERAGGDGVQP